MAPGRRISCLNSVRPLSGLAGGKEKQQWDCSYTPLQPRRGGRTHGHGFGDKWWAALRDGLARGWGHSQQDRRDSGFHLGFSPACGARILCRQGPCLQWGVLEGVSLSPPSEFSKETDIKPFQPRSLVHRRWREIRISMVICNGRLRTGYRGGDV